MSGKKLRRAKHLYALFIRNACEIDTTGEMLQECAKRAIERGLYAKLTGERSVRFSLLRKFWKKHPEFNGKYQTFGWHCYFRSQGYEGGSFTKRKFEVAA